MIRYKCDKCGAVLESPASMAGSNDTCPLCKHVAVVPVPRRGLPRWILFGTLGLTCLALGIVAILSLIGTRPAEKKTLLDEFNAIGTKDDPWVAAAEAMRAAKVADRPASKQLNTPRPQVPPQGSMVDQFDATGIQLSPAPQSDPIAEAGSAIIPPTERQLPLEWVQHSISISGVIGEDFTAREFRSRLAIADRFSRKANRIVLYIDSPGGSVADLEEILAEIQAAKSKRFVAVVDGKAMSAAAVVALACDTIYMADGARIGAATPYIQKADGDVLHLPAAVQEKQFSAMRALVRIAARHGGHSTALAEAMVDPAIKITMTKAGGAPVLQRDGNGSIVSRKGEVLTLTTEEAIDCGLARRVGDYNREFGEGLVSGKLELLRCLADDPLDDFASDLTVQYCRALFDRKASEAEAENVAREWARKTHATATWWHRPLPIVVLSVTKRSGGPHLYCVVGESLFRSALVFAGIRGNPPFMPFLQKGDVITITGALDLNHLQIDRWRGTLNFTECQCAQDR